MPATTTAGVYMLAAEHTEALQRFASDPTFARMADLTNPPAADAATLLVERTAAERQAGQSFWSVVVDRGEAKGVASVIDPYGTDPRVQFWIEPDARRRGYGELALRMTLEFAFRNLQVARVCAVPSEADVPAAALLAKSGFAKSLATSTPPNGACRWSITRSAWVAHRNKPALAALHPDLRAILDAELAAGNEVAETGGGWPDPDSVFIRLRDPFRTKPAQLPTGITYTEPNDPHWWKADYSSASPRHVLAC